MIAAYLFKNPMLFMHANQVVAHLMTQHCEAWMIETMLANLRFTKDINTKRTRESGNSPTSSDPTASPTVEELHFNFWVQFLDNRYGLCCVCVCVCAVSVLCQCCVYAV